MWRYGTLYDHPIEDFLLKSSSNTIHKSLNIKKRFQNICWRRHSTSSKCTNYNILTVSITKWFLYKFILLSFLWYNNPFDICPCKTWVSSDARFVLNLSPLYSQQFCFFFYWISEFCTSLSYFQVRDPMPAVFFFLVDVSMNAIQTGATAAACSAINQVIADLPVSACLL